VTDDQFQNLIVALSILAARPDDLNVGVATATFEINDHLARSSDREAALRRLRIAARAEAEMAKDQRPKRRAVLEYCAGIPRLS
jgi:hypothetical protein